MVKSWRLATILVALVGLAAAACSSSSTSSSTKPAAASTAPASFLSRLHTMAQVASTVPANGDVNPYGVAVVPASATTIAAGGALNEPLGMTLAPNGDLVVVNGNDGNAVEFSPAGRQLFTKTLIKNGAGDLFGITTTAAGELVAVNDGKNVIDIYRP